MADKKESAPLLGNQGSGAPSAPPPQVQGPVDYNAPRPTAPLPTAPRPTAPPPQYPNNGPYGAAIINQPRPQGHGVDLAVKPPTYMVLNVFAMVCCCFVCGLVGVLTAMQVESAWDKGERETAFRHSKNAKKWGVGGIVGGCIVHVFIWIPTIALIIGFGVIGANASST